jgi:hypothetical protein
LEVDILEVDILKVDIQEVDIVEVDIWEVDILEVNIWEVDILGVDILKVGIELQHQTGREMQLRFIGFSGTERNVTQISDVPSNLGVTWSVFHVVGFSGKKRNASRNMSFAFLGRSPVCH